MWPIINNVIQLQFNCNTIICYPRFSQTQEEQHMPGNSPMVSLRIPEDHLMELDRLVGFDGLRNRSDVIREAVRRMLSSSMPGKGEKIEVDLGPDLTIRLRDYCKIVGESADVVLRQSAREMIRKEMIEGATVVGLLSKRMDELRSRFDEDSNT
jgi:Arc/MetJ-type ribon-helix-helix transcriptional regulator